jgi:hypothetical protein
MDKILKRLGEVANKLDNMGKFIIADDITIIMKKIAQNAEDIYGEHPTNNVNYAPLESQG